MSAVGNRIGTESCILYFFFSAPTIIFNLTPRGKVTPVMNELHTSFVRFFCYILFQINDNDNIYTRVHHESMKKKKYMSIIINIVKGQFSRKEKQDEECI